jgi:mono/diheme cytochrome c family protein
MPFEPVPCLLVRVPKLPSRAALNSRSTRHAGTGPCARLMLSLLVVPLMLMIASARAADPAGKNAYGRVCARCHGDDPADGADGPSLLPMYRNAAQVLSIVRGGTGQMHPLPESKVSEAEVTAIVAWLQTLSN